MILFSVAFCKLISLIANYLTNHPFYSSYEKSIVRKTMHVTWVNMVISRWSGTSSVLIKIIIALGPVVQRVDNFIRHINRYPVDKMCSLIFNLIGQQAHFIHWIGIYLLDKVIFFVQLGPGCYNYYILYSIIVLTVV